MLELTVRGADQLADLSKRLRQAGEKDLRREMHRGIRRAAGPLIADAREHARATLPKHGGLNERVARSKFSVRARSGRDPGVRIIAKGVDARLDKAGRDRHPVFGDRHVWVVQQVRPGWFRIPMERGAPRVRRELLLAFHVVARRL